VTIQDVFEAVGAHGDLVLLRAEFGELGRELLA